MKNRVLTALALAATVAVGAFAGFKVEEEPPSIRAWMERLARPKATEQTRAATKRAAIF